MFISISLHPLLIVVCVSVPSPPLSVLDYWTSGWFYPHYTTAVSCFVISDGDYNVTEHSFM